MKFTIKKNRKGSKFIGVCKDKIKKKFYFETTINKHKYISPLIDNEIDAAKKYDEYVKINDPTKCKALNFPDPKKCKPRNFPEQKKVIKNKAIYSISKNKTKRPNIPNYVKLQIYSKQKNKCNLCNDNLDVCRIVDHIIPRYLGGYDNINNFQSICGKCNKWKTYNFDYFMKNYMKNNKKISLESILKIQNIEFNKFNGPYID
jgi:5-methylcytosine-specific restriction endonuclease McrA